MACGVGVWKIGAAAVAGTVTLLGAGAAVEHCYRNCGDYFGGSGSSAVARPQPNLRAYDAWRARTWQAARTATATAAAADALTWSRSSTWAGGSHGAPRTLDPTCWGCGASLTSAPAQSAAAAAASAAAAELARQQYWAREVKQRANTKAPRPDLNITVRSVAKTLWDAANDPSNDINLGIIGDDEQDDESHQPDAIEPGVSSPGTLPPAQGQLDDSCATGGHTSSSGERTNQTWQCGPGSMSEQWPESGIIDPLQVRFSQDSVSPHFKNKHSIADLADELRSGKVAAEEVPAIRLFERQGRLHTLDNRRLVAFQMAGVAIRYRMVTPGELRRELRQKFSTENSGTSIRIRGTGEIWRP